jgi:hypothetical protein
MRELTQYLSDVVTDVTRTAPTPRHLLRVGVTTHPIPFFGDPTAATVLTVGVNPSAGEFVRRSWPDHILVGELEARLVGYFNRRDVPPHPWFSPWSEALHHLRASYQSGAAHFGLSARPTAAMGSITGWQAFASLVEADARWFFRLLPLCKNAKVLLMAV